MRVFLDSCIWIGGIIVPAGYSGKILQYGVIRLITVVSSQMIFEEIQRHISEDNLAAFKKLLSAIKPEMVEIVPGYLQKWKGIITHKADFHVLEGAVKGKADYLLSRNKHVLNRRVKRELKPIQVLSPIEFLSEMV